jgi:hypothetical protein
MRRHRIKDRVLVVGMDTRDQEIRVMGSHDYFLSLGKEIDGVVIWVVVEMADASFWLTDDDRLVWACWGGRVALLFRTIALWLHVRAAREEGDSGGDASQNRIDWLARWLRCPSIDQPNRDAEGHALLACAAQPRVGPYRELNSWQRNSRERTRGGPLDVQYARLRVISSHFQNLAGESCVGVC